jgi:hypothetical protein
MWLFCYGRFDLLPKQTHGCLGANMSSVNVTVKHVFNLPLLKLFFEEEQLAALSGDTLHDKNLAVHLPNLSITSSSYADKLAVEEQARFDMRMIANQTKQSRTVYNSMAHYVVGSLAAKIQNSDYVTFDVFNLHNWILLLTSCIASIALLRAIILSVRLRALILTVASARQITAHNFPTLLVYARTSIVFPPVTSVNQTALIYTDRGLSRPVTCGGGAPPHGSRRRRRAAALTSAAAASEFFRRRRRGAAFRLT